MDTMDSASGLYDYTRIKSLRSRGRLLAEGLNDGALALVEGAFFDPALGFLQFQPGQPLEFLLELLGCDQEFWVGWAAGCLLYTSPSPRDRQKSRMPSSA